MRAFARLVSLLRVAAVAALGITTQVSPQSKEDLGACQPGVGIDVADVQIAACTRLINTGRLSRAQLAHAYRSRGRAYNNLYWSKEDNHFTQAIADLNKAISLEPSSADGFYIRGDSYSLIGMFDKAIDDFSQAIKLYPRGATVFRKGDAFSRRGLAYHGKAVHTSAPIDYEYDSKRAIADYTEAIRLNPKDWTDLCNRSHIYAVFHRDDLADADRRRANRINGSTYTEIYHPSQLTRLNHCE